MGIFDNFTADPDAKAPEYEIIDEGKYDFIIESMDGDKVVLKDIQSGKTIWQFFNFDDTKSRLAKAMGGKLEVGAKGKLEVKHTVSTKDGKTYANLQLPFELPTPGSYRVRIEKAEEKVSSTGKDMLVLTLLLSDNKSRVQYRWTAPNAQSSDKARAMASVNMNEIYNSFDGITRDMKNVKTWEGKVGAAIIGIEPDYQDSSIERAVVQKWIGVEGQRSLPAWGSVDKPVDMTQNPLEGEDDLPDFGL